MPATAAGSLYTINVVDAPVFARGSAELLRSNAIAAIEYLGQYVRWKGSLDFVIRWELGSRFPDYWSAGGPGFGAYGGIGGDGRTYAQSEAITGVDSNGSDYDAGMWVSPFNTAIRDYGNDVYLDVIPNPFDDDISGQRDFLSIFLHEVMHSLGMWSTDQHGNGNSAFDDLTFVSNGRWYFNGSKATEIYGSPLPLAATGSRDHYSHDLSIENDLVREFGFNEKWQITDIDLAVLHDLGLDVFRWQDEVTGLPLKRVFLTKESLYVHDYDGNMHGGASESVFDSYLFQGAADVNVDGVDDLIYTNEESGRWAVIKSTPSGIPDWQDFGAGGGTRIVGIYEDPLIAVGNANNGFLQDGVTPAPANYGVSESERYVVVGGNRIDRLALNSQVRFQNDLTSDNLRLGSAADVDKDGFGEVFWKTTDGAAFLRSIHHFDGNVQYANYMNAVQMTDYLSDHGRLGDIGSRLGL